FFFFQAEDGIRDFHVTGVQTCALPISSNSTALPFPISLSCLSVDSAWRPDRSTANVHFELSPISYCAKCMPLRCTVHPTFNNGKIGRASCRQRVLIPAIGACREYTASQ